MKNYTSHLLQRAHVGLRSLNLQLTVISEVLMFGLLLPVLLLWWLPSGLVGAVWLTLVLVPLWLGLRFGLLAGSLVAGLTGLVIFAMGSFQANKKPEFPNVHLLVMLAVGMASGEMRDRWAHKAAQLQTLGQYCSTRLKQFTGAYQVLQISHAQLERRVVDSAGNLRQALQRLQQRSMGLQGGASLTDSGLGSWLLEIFADLGNVHAAALYEVNARGMLRHPAVARLGPAAELSMFDPMLREALSNARLTTVRTDPELSHGNVLALIPIADSQGRVHGVVAIFDMLFVNMQQQTFEVLAVLGQHLGDILSGRPHSVDEAQGWGSFSDTIRHQFSQADHAVFPVALVACTVTALERRDALAAHLCRGVRGLDQCWVMLDRQGRPVILKTMPLTDAAGVASHMARLEREMPGSSFGFVRHEWLLHESPSAEDVLVSVRQVCALDQFEPESPIGRASANGSNT
ncbi:hypothetical protein DIC66_21240 [Rhodoferax lacus]|uniref:PelD GGDEF domain-containing protein n=1 Tax=Rhodoferax lacus TaxID=2184758 RepID=A0A3E1R6K8_9BURK|nr:PelD GGDEF domain-containing protein [Rhodoferax lacus]RFO94863.1 hypothetical protein DIC66_21240 [Rhodoferax lacus]